MTRIVSYRSKRNYYLRRQRQRHFLRSPWAGGGVLVIFAAIALLLANLDATKTFYHHLLTTDFTVGFPGFNLTRSIEAWINDGLMVVFFFVVGLEIKREIIAGQLASIKHAALPIAGAIGGMLVPAAIYMAFNAGTPTESGWGIPMATDIAFAIGILSLLGDRVPVSLKIFLTALAIVDDLGAILVIAIFYSSEINFVALAAAVAVFALLLVLNRNNVYKMRYYLVPSIVLWVLFLHSGIHATIAGVLIALTIPTTPRYSKKYFLYKSKYFREEFAHFDQPDAEVLANDHQHHALNSMRYLAANAMSPSQRLEHALNPTVTFFIMPVFALANAGVEIASAADLNIFATGEGMGIFWGLVIGKPLGIVLTCWLTVKLGLAALPEGANWHKLASGACLGGIGFTMSIFIDTLAFNDPGSISLGKITILIASVTAALLGILIINTVGKKDRIGPYSVPGTK